MGRRRTRTRPPPPRVPRLPVVFDCLFCNGRDTIEVRMDRTLEMGSLKCRVCPASFQMQSCYLDEPVDVYSKWVDEATEANYEPYGSYTSLGDDGIPEPAYARTVNLPAEDVNAPLMRPVSASSRQPERARSSQSVSSSSSQSARADSEADELQGQSQGAAYAIQSPAYDTPIVDAETKITSPVIVPDVVTASASTCYLVPSGSPATAPTNTQSLDCEANNESALEEFCDGEMGRPTGFYGTEGPVVTAAFSNGGESDDITIHTQTLPSRDNACVQVGREPRRSTRIAGKLAAQTPEVAQQPRRRAAERTASVKTRTHTAIATPVAAEPLAPQLDDAPGPDEVFAVQKLVRPVVFEGEPSYVVLWKGYKETTVEPRCNLIRDIATEVNTFEQAHRVLWRRNKANRNAYTWKQTISPRSRRMSESVQATTHEPQVISGDVPHVPKDKNKRVTKQQRVEPPRRPSPQMRNKLGAQASHAAEGSHSPEHMDESAALEDLKEIEQDGLRVVWPSQLRPHSAEEESGPSRPPVRLEPAPEVLDAMHELPVAAGMMGMPTSSPGDTPPPATPCTTIGRNTKNNLASEPKEARRRSPRIASQKIVAQAAGERQQQQQQQLQQQQQQQERSKHQGRPYFNHFENLASEPKEPRRRSPRIASQKMAAQAAGEPQQQERPNHQGRPHFNQSENLSSEPKQARRRSPRVASQKMAAQAAGEPQQQERSKHQGGASSRETSSRRASLQLRALAAAAPVAMQSTAPEAAEDSCREELYAIQRILRPTIDEGESCYVVLWKGYKDPTVEPRSNLQRDVGQLVENFERAHNVKWQSTPSRYTWRKKIPSRVRKTASKR